MSASRHAAFALVVVLWLGLPAARIRAQTATGSVTGSVADTSGALVAGATIRIKHVPTGRESETASSAAGVYAFPTLEVGPYTRTVEQAGFKTTTRPGLVVAISATLVVNVTLEVGDVTQSVNVEAASPRLSSATSELSQTFQPKMLTDAPLFVGGAMRNPEAFVAYMPGVSTVQQVPNGSSNNGAQDTASTAVSSARKRCCSTARA